jgi:hypothetical protein
MGVADLFGAENGEADNAQLLRASKTSKLGARAGRVGKIVKLIRSVRLLRVIRQVYSIQRTRKKKQLDKKMDEMGLCSPVVIAKGEGGGGEGKDDGKNTMQNVVAKALEHKVALKHNDALKARTQGTSQVAEQTGEMISLRVAVLVMLACIVSPLLQWQDFDEGKTAYVAMLESFPASREWHQDRGSFSHDFSAAGNTAASRSWDPASVHAVYDTTAAQIRAMYQSTLTIPLSLAVSFADGGANSTSTSTSTNNGTNKLTTSSTSTPAGNGSNATSQWSWDSARPARSSFLSTLKSPRVTLLFNNGPLKRQEAAYSCLLMLFIIVVLLVWSSNLNLVLHRMLIAPVHRTLAIIKAGATKVIEMSRTEGDEGGDMLVEFEGSVGVLDEVEQIELMLAKMTRLLASGDLNARSASARVAEMIRVQDVKDDDVKDWLYVTYTNTKGTGGQRSGDGEDDGGGRGNRARQHGGSGGGATSSHCFIVASTTTARDDIEDGPLEGSFVQYEENESTVATSTNNNGRSTTSPNQLDSYTSGYTRADGSGAGALGGIGGVIGGGIVAGSPRSVLASGGFSISEVKLSAWTYSTYEYPEEVLILHMVAIYEIMGVMTLLDRNTIIAFTDRIRRLYLEVPYHNFRHAMDVVQAIFWVLQRVDARSWLPMDDIMALLTAALCHDVCHPGVNNAFLINTQHELALTYNDQCPLESMHCATAFQVMEDDEVNLLHRLNEQQFRWVRAYMVDAILATDGAHHFKMLAELQAFKEKNHVGKHGKVHSDFGETSSASSRGAGGGKRRNAMWAQDKWKLAAKKIRAAGRFGGESGGGGAWRNGEQHRKKPRQQMWCEGPESRLLFGRMMLHTADISNPARPFKECAKLAVLVMEEFYSRKHLRLLN